MERVGLAFEIQSSLVTCAMDFLKLILPSTLNFVFHTFFFILFFFCFNNVIPFNFSRRKISSYMKNVFVNTAVTGKTTFRVIINE